MVAHRGERAPVPATAQRGHAGRHGRQDGEFEDVVRAVAAETGRAAQPQRGGRVGLGEDEPAHRDPDGERGQGEREAVPPDGGYAGEQAERGDERHGQGQGGEFRHRREQRQAPGGEERGEEGAEAGVRGLAE